MKIRTPIGLRLVVTAAFGCVAAMGLGFALFPDLDPEGFATGDRVFFTVLGLLGLASAVRVWRCSIFIRDHQLVARGFLRTRQIALRNVLDITAIQSDWLPFWVLVVRTPEREYVFEDVREYPWRAGGERMDRAATDLLNHARMVRESEGPVSETPEE